VSLAGGKPLAALRGFGWRSARGFVAFRRQLTAWPAQGCGCAHVLTRSSLRSAAASGRAPALPIPLALLASRRPEVQTS